MAMGGGHAPGTMMAEINVTPLVDVMLVLLIIFMITAPMLQQGVDVDLPDAKAQTIPDDEGKLVLTVTKDHRYFVGRAEVKFAELGDKIKTNAKLQADKELYLHADKALPYGDVVEVMAILKDSGIDKLGMITDPMRYANERAADKEEAAQAAGQ
jgi:biopolymer transport protein TolR